ncbi:MAG: sodium-independent anion transporter [Desulfobacterales bacterium]
MKKLFSRAVTPVKWFVLDTQAMNDIDTTGAETMHQVLTWLTKRGVTFALSRANQSTTALLSRYHLLELIRKNRLYPTNCHAIAVCRRETEQAEPEVAAE